MQRVTNSFFQTTILLTTVLLGIYANAQGTVESNTRSDAITSNYSRNLASKPTESPESATLEPSASGTGFSEIGRLDAPGLAPQTNSLWGSNKDPKLSKEGFGPGSAGTVGNIGAGGSAGGGSGTGPLTPLGAGSGRP